MNTVTWRLGPAAALGLANSQHGPGAHYRRRAHPSEPAHDHLGTPDDALAFLSTHDIPTPGDPPSLAQLARLRSTRDLIRSLADDPMHDPVAWRAAVEDALDGVDYRLRSDGSMRSASDGWNGVIDDLLPAALALADEHARIRACGNPLCRWLFVDRSRNGSRVWCEMAVCGNRMKVGRHRLRPGATDRVPERSPATARALDRPAVVGRRGVSRPGTPSGPRG